MTYSRRLLFLYNMAYYERLASAIQNDVYSGLQGYHENLSMNIDQLQDEIVQERLAIIKELTLKGTLPKKDLLLSLNCIPVDCKDIENCGICSKIQGFEGTPVAHFEIPQVITDFDNLGIEYIGTVDKQLRFTVYTSLTAAALHKYRKRRAHKPYVYIDTTPNENNMYDVFLFNAPFIQMVSVIGVFKDLRQVEESNCCIDLSYNFTFIDSLIQQKVTEKKIRYYRQLSMPNLPNDQSYK